MDIVVDGTPVGSAVIAAAAARPNRYALAPAALDAIAGAAELADAIAATRPIYGRSTGVGANRSVLLNDVSANPEHARRLLRSHATSAGDVRSDARIRATMYVRLNQLAAGGSGARPEIALALAARLSTDDLPTVRERGSIGTGDLPALATIALALAEDGVEFHASDALALLSSNAATIADAALAASTMRHLASAALDVAALTFAGAAGNAEAFSPLVERATPFAGARTVCRSMRALVGTHVPARIQDPFGLRALPQVHGAFLDALERLDDVIAALSAAPAENPAVGDGQIAHHGGFHAAYLAQALDAATSAAAQTAQLVLARVSMLCEPGITKLTPFLTDGTPGASGVMVCEYVAADALSALRALTAPVAVQSVTLSLGVEDNASFAALGARSLAAAAEQLQTMLACELVVATRAVRLRGGEVTGPAAELPDDVADRNLTSDLALAAELLSRFT